MGSSIVNDSEIAGADNTEGIADEDSTPGDNAGDPSETGSDNDIADDSNGGSDNPADNDDFDPAEVTVGQVFDLALTKVFASSSTTPIVPGSSVTFDITVYNQGTLDAVNVLVEDYIPAGMTFVSSPDFALSGTQYLATVCLLYTSPSPRDATLSRMPSSA